MYASDDVSLLQFVGLVLKESPIDGELPAYVYDSSKNNDWWSLTAISIGLFTTVGLFLVLCLHHSWGVVGTVLAQSQVARHTMWSSMLASWILLPWAMREYFIGTRAMEEDVQHERFFTLFPDVYSKQVDNGYAEWGTCLVILLLEAPLLCVFFLRKSINLRKKEHISKSECFLCFWITVLCDTLGGIGMVAAVQVISISLFYWALYFTLSPIFTIALVSNFFACIVIFLVCTTLLMQMVSSCCRNCSLGKIIKGLGFLLLALLSITINYYVTRQVSEDKRNNSSGINGVMTSVVSSVIIGMYGYIVKKLLFQKKGDAEGTEREELESKPLLQEAPSP